MPGVPMYSIIESRDGSLTKASYLKNGFIEKAGDDYNTFRRAGMRLYGTTTAGFGQGITNYFDPNGDEFLFSVIGGVLYNNGALIPGTDWTKSGTFSVNDGTFPTLINASLISWNGFLWMVGGNRVAGGVGNTRFVVYYSTDNGANFTKLVDVANGTSGYPGAGSWQACVHNNKLYLVQGRDGAGAYYNDCWYTTNGVTWTQASAACGFPSLDCVHLLSHSDGKMYAFFETTTNPVWTSTDGTSWASAAATAAYNTSGTRTAYGAVSKDGNLWVLGGSQTTNSAKVYQSTNAVTWTELGSNALSTVIAGSSNNANYCLVIGGVIYLLELSDSNTEISKFWISPNGTSWTDVGTWNFADSGDPDFLINNNTGAWQLGAKQFVTHRRAIFGFGMVHGATQNLDQFLYLWKVTQSTSGTIIGSAVGNVGAGFIDFAQNFARTVLAVKSPSSLYSLSTVTQALSAVTDTDYPAQTVRGIVYLNGVFYVMDPDGTIYGSDDENLSSWTATNFLNAEYESDGGVCLIKYGLYIVAFGEYTTEYFYDAGNASGSSLSPVQNGVINIGCADGDTVITIDDQVFFVGRSKGPSQSVTNARFVAKLSGTGFERVSTPDIDRILISDDFNDVDAVGFSVGGHSYYHLRLGTSNFSLVYDLSQQTWTVWDRRRDSFTNTLTNVVTTNGTATWTGTHSFADGDVGVISAFSGTHTNLNGTFNVTVPGTNTNTLCWRLSSQSYSGTSTGTGTATGWASDDFGVTGATGYFGQQLLLDKSSGNLFELDPDIYQDNSIYMDWSCRTGKQDAGSDRDKFVVWADFISDRVSGNVLLRFSDNDYQNWTKYKSKSMAGRRTQWNRLGQMKRRVFEARVTDNVPVRAQRLELNLMGGAS